MAATPDHLPSILAFVSQLHEGGVARAGPREYAAIERWLRAQDPAQIEWTELRAMLASVLATNKQEWNRVADRFDAQFVRPVQIAESSSSESSVGPGAPEDQDDEPERPTLQVARAPKPGPLQQLLGTLRAQLRVTTQTWIILGLGVVLIGAELALIRLMQPPWPLDDPFVPPVTTSKPASSSSRLVLLQAQRTDTVSVPWIPDPVPSTVAVLSALASALLVTLGIWCLAAPSTRREDPARQQRLQRGQERLMEAERALDREGGSLRVEHAVEVSPALSASAIADSAQHLGRVFRSAEARDIAVNRTLAATTRAGGRFTPVMADRKLRAEVLVLVDEEDGDHPYLAGFVRVIEQWKRLGVRVLDYRFRNAPNWLIDPDTRERVPLRAVARRTSDLPLVFFARAPRTDDYKFAAVPWLALLETWAPKAWLDPDPRPRQGRDAVSGQHIGALCAAGLVRFPMTDDGVTWMARWLALEGEGPVPTEPKDWVHCAPPPPAGAATDEALRLWALAGALVPDPGWDQLEALRLEFPEIRAQLPHRHHVQWLIDWIARETGNPTPDKFQGGRSLSIKHKHQVNWVARERAAAGGPTAFERRAHAVLIKQIKAAEEPTSALLVEERALKLAIHQAQLEPERTLELLGWALREDALVFQKAVTFVEGERELRQRGVGTEIPRAQQDTLGTAVRPASSVTLAGFLRVGPQALLGLVAVAGLAGTLSYESLTTSNRQPARWQERVTSRVQWEPNWALTPAFESTVPMVALPAGTFLMGRPDDEEERYSDEQQHEVRLTRPFLIGKSEVTQGQYEQVLGAGTLYSGEDDLGNNCAAAGVNPQFPAVCVTWLEAVRFANELSRQEGYTAAYIINGGDVLWVKSAEGYRLPTEAEWEYAARAGQQMRFVGTDSANEVCAYGNLADQSGAEAFGWPADATFACNDGAAGLASVDAYEPNLWGLDGAGGNAAEWVWDWYSDFDRRALEDPGGPAFGANRVVRGASWRRSRRGARVAGRAWYLPGGRRDGVGFRLARSCSPSAVYPSDCFPAPKARQDP